MAATTAVIGSRLHTPDSWRRSLVPVAAILDPDRSAETVLARALAMYLSHIGFGMSYGRVSQVFGRDRSTVADACRQIEERREDPRFDRWLEALERSITSAPAPYRRDAA